MSTDNCQMGFGRPWIWQNRKELPLGLLYYPSQSLGSHYISLLFMILWPYSMAGHHLDCPPNMNVVTLSM